MPEDQKSRCVKASTGYLLAKALPEAEFQTVISIPLRDILSSKDGVQAVIRLLLQFNPTRHANEVFMSLKALMMET